MPKKSFLSRRRPPARWNRLVRRAVARQRAGKVFSKSILAASGTKKTFPTRRSPPAIWKSLFQRTKTGRREEIKGCRAPAAVGDGQIPVALPSSVCGVHLRLNVERRCHHWSHPASSTRRSASATRISPDSGFGSSPSLIAQFSHPAIQPRRGDRIKPGAAAPGHGHRNACSPGGATDPHFRHQRASLVWLAISQALQVCLDGGFQLGGFSELRVQLGDESLHLLRERLGVVLTSSAPT